MRWPTFAIFAYLMLAAQIGLRPLLAIPDAQTGVSPSFMLVLFVWLALSAPPLVVAWAGLIIGALIDLMYRQDIVGPSALAYLAAAYVALKLRTIVFRDSIISLAALTFAVGVAMHLITTFLLSIRGLPFLPGEAMPNWHASEHLVDSFFALLYTVIASVPVGALLRRSQRLWAFQHTKKR